MRSCKKKVYVYCHHPIAVDPECGVSWADVWLRLYKRRTPIRLAPTLCGRMSLDRDIQVREELVSDGENSIAPDDQLSRDLGLTDPPDPEAYRPDLLRLQALRARLDTEGIVIDDEPGHARKPARNFALANIYTTTDLIDRAMAVRMMDAYLAKIGVSGATYKWNRPEYVVSPV